MQYSTVNHNFFYLKKSQVHITICHKICFLIVEHLKVQTVMSSYFVSHYLVVVFFINLTLYLCLKGLT